jgi:hypothetical protein
MTTHLAPTSSACSPPSRLEVSVRVIADAPVSLVDHARAERPGLDQVERDVFGDRRQERRAATDERRRARRSSGMFTESAN